MFLFCVCFVCLFVVVLVPPGVSADLQPGTKSHRWNVAWAAAVASLWIRCSLSVCHSLWLAGARLHPHPTIIRVCVCGCVCVWYVCVSFFMISLYFWQSTFPQATGFQRHFSYRWCFCLLTNVVCFRIWVTVPRDIIQPPAQLHSWLDKRLRNSFITWTI